MTRVNGDLPQLSLTITRFQNVIVDWPSVTLHTCTNYVCVNSGINGGGELMLFNLCFPKKNKVYLPNLHINRYLGPSWISILGKVFRSFINTGGIMDSSNWKLDHLSLSPSPPPPPQGALKSIKWDHRWNMRYILPVINNHQSSLMPFLTRSDSSICLIYSSNTPIYILYSEYFLIDQSMNYNSEKSINKLNLPHNFSVPYNHKSQMYAPAWNKGTKGQV